MGKWLVKSDPEDYSFEDLKKDKETEWDGVRNNLAAIHLKAMKKGDEVFVYHSGKEKTVVGIAKVTREAYPDVTDETGRFVSVDLRYVSHLESPVTLKQIKAEKSLGELSLVKMSRLSVMPVEEKHWKKIQKMGGESGASGSGKKKRTN